MRHIRLKNSIARRTWVKLASTRLKPVAEPRFVVQPRDTRARAAAPAGGKA